MSAFGIRADYLGSLASNFWAWVPLFVNQVVSLG